MQNILLTFGPNELGRDFVIGDLHGSFSCFTNLCANIEFDPLVDRMFSVADLVDRGPESLKCLQLLRKKWFHCVLANHEQMMLDAFNGGRMGMFWEPNGGQWGTSALMMAGNQVSRLAAGPEDKELYDLLSLVEKLPFLITINHKSGKKFHIIHAELPPLIGITDTDLADPEIVFGLATVQTDNGDAFLWGRDVFLPFYKADLSNEEKVKRTAKYNNVGAVYSDSLSHIISGHTIIQRPITMVGQTNIDTCAYGSYNDNAPKWKALTCLCLDDWTFVQATETEFRSVTPVVLNSSDLG